jgi:hypothetical protein
LPYGPYALIVTNWGDVPTWLLVFVGTVGGGAALRQLGLQRRQLGLQQEQLAADTLVREREQANMVEMQVRPVDGGTANVLPPDDHRQVLMAEVFNGSKRPIRAVTAMAVEEGKLPRPDPVLVAPDRYGVVMTYGLGPNFGEGTTKADHIAWVDHGPVNHLLTAGDKTTFVWSLGPEDQRRLPIAARFTDDAGLFWELTPDLRLKKLTSREW